MTYNGQKLIPNQIINFLNIFWKLSAFKIQFKNNSTCVYLIIFFKLVGNSKDKRKF